MKIFLTGATGFIGSYFLEEALKKGHIIYAHSRKKNKNKKNLKWLYGSFDKNWKELKKCDVLIHLAAAGVNNKNISIKDAFDVNVTRSINLLTNAAKANCKNWLIVGSASEYGRTALKKRPLNVNSKLLPETSYEISKYFFSKLAIKISKKFKCKCRVMRLFPVYGKGELEGRLYPSLLTSIKKKKKFILNKPNIVRDFINAKEVAQILLQAANFKIKNKIFPQIWHVASGKPVSLKSFVRYICKKNNSKIKIIFKNVNNKNNHNYISDQKSIWKLY
jgi:dTDP-6-deoxy-L-talose 4-dehydrogenase (NAD+)